MQLPEPLKQDLEHHKVFISINLLYWKMLPPMAGALNLLKVHSNINYSVILLNIWIFQLPRSIWSYSSLCLFASSSLFSLHSSTNQIKFKIMSTSIAVMAILKWVYTIIYSLVLGKTQRKKKYIYSIQFLNKKLFSPFLIPYHLKYTQKNNAMEKT